MEQQELSPKSDSERLMHQALLEIGDASSSEELEKLRIKYQGRKGVITKALKGLGQLPREQRAEAGKGINIAKKRIDEAIKERGLALTQEEADHRLAKESIDVTLPGRWPAHGGFHPINLVIDEIKKIAGELGFDIAEGPEVEHEWYNFGALNFPPEHPARDTQDTLFISDDILLRTHTSPVQIRVMESRKPPLRVICPGKVYRSDDIDPSHSPMFHQVEGLMVGEDVTFAHLKAVLIAFAQRLFGNDRKVRIRPSFFPFTEPSTEVDISCKMCDGRGCRVCSNKGWMEILGAGMVDPAVFENVGYDPEKVTGFAFGMGPERIAMLKYGIEDIRLFYENDLFFLRQFKRF
ncbi:MAG: phenylalanine--tRNA ligase subunit alpha [bacterium]|nr:phenylalanine--tRNA ligase subunit alpha [bacterium]